jgi:hypothetical protein
MSREEETNTNERQEVAKQGARRMTTKRPSGSLCEARRAREAWRAELAAKNTASVEAPQARGTRKPAKPPRDFAAAIARSEAWHGSSPKRDDRE